MSHLRERVQKDCLNCNARVAGRYCHICGQENTEIKESTWQLVTHFFNDITHFDGKFFSTLRYLLFKPGFVSTEYIHGRRASYLNPIRMYIFTSALFFLIFFSIFKVDQESVTVNTEFNKDKIARIEKMDSASFAAYTSSFNNGKPMTRKAFRKYSGKSNDTLGLKVLGNSYKSKHEYDSLLKSGKLNDNWLERTLNYREIELNEKYKNDKGKIMSIFMNILVHSFPQMLFISLPLFALVLQLVYVRRKQYYYTNHLIFSVHLYILFFIVLLIIIGFTQLKEYVSWNIINWIIAFLYISLFYYEYRSMRNFYQQRRGKTIMKFLILNFIHLVIIIFLLVMFTLFSFLKI
ncbi:MAG: DUF3667 domain-containing protein [Ferruginibacter sp.]